MKRVLAVHYSQSGQLTEILDSILRPLRESPAIEVVEERLRSLPPYPFPWPVYRFLDVFAESVLLVPPRIEPPAFDPGAEFDLVILGYTVWYLAPSPPLVAFLRSPAARVMDGVPVVTVVNARDKWLSAQEKVKEELSRIGGRLVDHVALVHQGNPAQHLVTTLRWMWTGKKGGFWGLFPPAGVASSEIHAADRFGRALRDALESGTIGRSGPALAGLGAVRVDEDTVIQERLAYPHFVFWARIIRAASDPGSWRRVPLQIAFALYLLAMILAAAPVVVLYKLFFRRLLRGRVDAWIGYYERPSGSSTV